MKNNLLILTFLVSNFFGFTQETDKNIRQGKHYTSIRSYKELYGDNFTKNDSLKFIIQENDTLVPLPKDHKRPNGVSVPYEARDSTFLEIYKDIVYKKFSKDSSKKRKIYMKLWKAPIKIYFGKSVDERYIKIIKRLTTSISKEVDSLDISIVNEVEKSNYIIYQINENNKYKYSKNLPKNKYIDYYSYWKKSVIYDTKLEINTTKYKNKVVNVNYLIQSFIKSLGHFNTTDKVPSKSVFFKSNSGKKRFTKEDLEILKYHYSYGICKFTDLEKFEEAHNKAKETFSKTGRYPKFINK